MAQRPTQNNRQSWHIGKEVPAALIFTMFAQTIGVVWWAAGLTGEVRDIARRVGGLEIRVDGVTTSVHALAAPNAASLVRIDSLVGSIADLRGQIEQLRDKLRNR